MPYQVYNPILDKHGGPVLFALFGALPRLGVPAPLLALGAGHLAKAHHQRRRLRAGIHRHAPGAHPRGAGCRILAQRGHVGVLNVIPMPAWLHGVLSFLFMDYLLYVWHVLSHKVPLLWRFHNVHHTDLDLGVSTALRFHFGEMFLSGVFRAAAVLLFGAGAVAVLVYEVVFEASVAFQHSNWKLPYPLEHVLARVIITPRMHGIHHSIVPRETNSNFTNLFNLWDRLHGTIRLNVPQNQITIGVPAYRDERELTARGLILLPFRRQKPYWQLPDGSEPGRHERGNRARLVE